MVTWRHSPGRALIIVRKGRGNFSDHQVAACAEATVRTRPHHRPRSSSDQQAYKKRPKKNSDSIKRSMALGYRRSKSLTNLNAFDVDTNPFTGQVRCHKADMSASCSALDLPLPPRPVRMSVLYEEDGCRGQHELLSVNENVAYTTSVNMNIGNRPPYPPPYSKTPQPGPVYEQLDLVESTAF